MRKWISIGVAAALLLVLSWKVWMPWAIEGVLREQRGISFRQWKVLLLQAADPALRGIGLYMAEPPEEAEEHFLYFVPPQEEPQGEDEAVKAANLSALSGIYTQYNGTAVANATDYGITELLDRAVSMPKFEAGKPAVLIYHTHTTECYRNNQGISNTRDEALNVVAVGEAIKRVFEEAGYPTIHIKDVFNQPDFSGAYTHSRAAVEKVLKENPSIKVVLDVHRDAISSNGVDYYPVTSVNGREAAQVMLVCGTDSKGLSHPNWRQNFTYALQLSRRMGTLYGEISRPVNLRRDRFNTHFTPYTLLLEVGSSANTLEQAIYGGELTAKAMIDLWKSA